MRGAEVCSDDFRSGKAVCHVDCPEPGPSADVEDGGRIFYGCEEEFVVQGQEPEVVTGRVVGQNLESSAKMDGVGR